MCGIFGYIGNREADNVVINGLKKLEYRGYDSWGVSIIQNEKILSEKHVGKIGDVSSHKKIKKIETNNPEKKISLGIGHTRWATHGGVTEKNAHPHLSCNGEIAIVHNGIIENFEVLKELLLREGHKFSSETDTEVIAHLIEKFYSGNLQEAVRSTTKLLEGTFGILAIHKSEEIIVAVKKGSPLVLGIGEKEFFVASDVSPIVEYTKSVIYLDDGDILAISKDNYKITDFRNSKLTKNIDQISWSIEEIKKKGFKHFMLKEIFEQPESITNTIRGRLPDGDVKLGGPGLTEKDAKKISRIIIIACGTSWHSGLVGEYLIEDFLQIPTEVEYASEFRYRNPPITKNDLVIVISQSGETADTLAALQLAKKAGARTLGIVNVVGSTIARESNGGIYIHAGPEIGVASTKAFSCQIVALCLLTLYIGKLRGGLSKEKSSSLIKNLKILPELIKETLTCSDEVFEIAKKYSHISNFLYLGRGYEFPVALEGALKLKEISYIHAEGYPAAEMKHGPIALIDEKMPVVFLANKTAAYEKVISNMREVKARNGKVIAIATRGDENIGKIADDVIFIPETIEPLMPVLSTIPLQLLAYYIADLRKCDIDKPRNLAKSVTVE